jgi:hypothetical protein
MNPRRQIQIIIVELAVLLFSSQAFSQIIITELQRDPAGGETSSPGGASHEFVEFTNMGADTFGLDSLCLTDGVEADTVIPWPSPLPIHGDCVTGSAKLPPGGTALILDRDYPAAVASVASSRLPIRAGTVLLTVGDAEIGNGLAADDGVLIYKGTKASVAAALWCAGDVPFAGTAPTAGKIVLSRPLNVPEGFSVVPVSFLFDSTRYGICADSLTPGSFELLKNSWFAEWRFGTPDSLQRNFACTISCCKAGSLPQPPVGYAVAVQSRTKTTIAAQGVFSVQGNRAAALFALPLDSASYFLRLTEQGAESEWLLDVSQLWTPPLPLRINEIFPRANAGEPEWFEVVNVSSMTINLKNWTFGNNEQNDTVTAQDSYLSPGGFLVFTANRALFCLRYPAKNRAAAPPHWHTLDNYNDTLCLWDSRAVLKERVCYMGGWFPGWTGGSLERVALSNSGMDPASWVVAPSPTPGQPNGALSWRATASPRLDAGPLPFTPNNDGRDDELAIAVDLPAGYSATVAVYGFSGKKLREFGGTLAHRISWDGKQDNGRPAPTGPFFVVMTATSAHGSVTVKKNGVLWR